jgi:hypothetical protein
MSLTQINRSPTPTKTTASAVNQNETNLGVDAPTGRITAANRARIVGARSAMRVSQQVIHFTIAPEAYDSTRRHADTIVCVPRQLVVLIRATKRVARSVVKPRCQGNSSCQVLYPG